MVFKRPALQIALDLVDLGRALEIATSTTYNLPREHLIIEAGTPLIKSWGAIAPRLLKKATGAPVFADTKTMDTGSLEAKLMIDNGADIVSVLGVASNDTIIELVEETHRHGKLAALDLINNPEPISTAIKAIEYGVDIIIYHVGVDVQRKRGVTAADLINEVNHLIKKIKGMGRRTYIAVAGGLRPGSIARFIDIGVDIVIVGSAITGSRDPLSVSRSILEEMGVL